MTTLLAIAYIAPILAAVPVAVKVARAVQSILRTVL